MPVQYRMIATPVTLTAGTPVALTSTVKILVCYVEIEADALNTGKIYYGASSVTSTNGHAIAAGASRSLNNDTSPGNQPFIRLSDIYLATDTTGNAARVSYFYVEGS